MATYNLDDDKSFDYITIAKVQYAVWDLATLPSVQEMIEGIDDEKPLREQWLKIMTTILNEYNTWVDVNKASDMDLSMFALFISEKILWG
jgi:hypothetical protein